MKHLAANILKLTALYIFVALIATLAISAQRNITKVQKAAPLGTTLVYCNEKDSMRETVRLPSEGISANGETIAAWRFLLSDSKGKYNFSMRSAYPFAIVVRQKTHSTGKWSIINSRNVRPNFQQPAGIQPYYYWNSLRVSQVQNPRNSSEFSVSVRPSRTYQNLVATWYTSGCERSQPDNPVRDNSCRWGKGGLFSASDVCVCGGNEVALSRCKGLKKP